jgi:glycosyltransferase involved in cell wall biosynthesis
MQNLLDRLLHRERFDILQVEDNAMAGYEFNTTIPSVLTEHEVREAGPDSPDEPWRSAPLLARLNRMQHARWKAYQAKAWSRFDRIQVFTARDRAALSGIAPSLTERVRLNPFGVEVPPSPVEGPGAEGSVVFVGAFVHEPNVDAALWLHNEIMPLVRASTPAAHLTIVGREPPPEVRALHGAHTCVTGQVESVETYLDRAAVVVAPVRTGAGMRLKVLQAMAHGRAVVATPTGAEGLATAVGCVPLLTATDARDFAAAVVRLLDEPHTRQQLGAQARAFVEKNFGWPAHIQRLESIYKELMAAR